MNAHGVACGCDTLPTHAGRASPFIRLNRESFSQVNDCAKKEDSLRAQQLYDWHMCHAVVIIPGPFSVYERVWGRS